MFKSISLPTASGGLVSRYYLQSGKFTADPGFSSIKTFITFGTPHNGAAVALAGALGLHKTSFMSIEQSKQLANDARYPALYQTFPLFNAPLIWKSMPRGRLEPITLSDTQFVTEKLHLNKQNLDRASTFRRSLDAAPIPKEIRCFLLIGSRFETITHFFWTGNTLQKEETPDGGDGTVSIEGAYLGGTQVQFTGESHIELIELQRCPRDIPTTFRCRWPCRPRNRAADPLRPRSYGRCWPRGLHSHQGRGGVCPFLRPIGVGTRRCLAGQEGARWA